MADSHPTDPTKACRRGVPGHVFKKDMQRAILDYFKNFTDLKIKLNEMFLSQDGTRLAIQWDWTVTRKRDRKRTTTHDAILVHLVGRKIATWNEYFGGV